MERPLSSGDICVVLHGLTRKNSPNVGKIVTIDKRIFGDLGRDHSEYGPVYRCNGTGVSQLADNGEFVITGIADFPGIWLKRIDPPVIVKENVHELEKHE